MLEQRLLCEGLRFAEAPRWHMDRLWFSDVHDYTLKSVTLAGVVATVARFPGRPSGLGVLPDGRLLMATALDRKLWAVTPSGEASEVADLSALATGLLNDMVVDGQGRAFVGDTGFRMGAEPPKPGRVIHWRAGQAARVVAEDVTFPNGCVITPDGARYLVAETMAQRISAFTVASDGSLGERSVFATLESPPDGLCMDADGALWVGLPLKGEFVRIGPDGNVLQRLASAAPFAVTCALGGPERRTLFLCSAFTDLQRLGRGETTARIDACDAPAPGVGWP
jgi:sugar lactone lactonase YvrE